jgi:hypothetical protein
MTHFKQIEILLKRKDRSDLILPMRREYKQMEFPDDIDRQSAKNAFCVNYLLEKYPEQVPKTVRK